MGRLAAFLERVGLLPSHSSKLEQQTKVAEQLALRALQLGVELEASQGREQLLKKELARTKRFLTFSRQQNVQLIGQLGRVEKKLARATRRVSAP